LNKKVGGFISMKKSAATMAVLIMAVSAALTGCGNSDQQPEESKTKTVSVQDGVKELLSVANDLKAAINSGDEAKIKETGPKLEDEWGSFEDEVHDKNPDLYAEVEKYLDPAVAGSKADSIDKETLSKLDDKLIGVVNELSRKAG
jgi:iron uptake system EfeUOB component EfeO/EfeM